MENLDQGLILTGLGMLWVFVFLTLMIGLISLSAFIIGKFFPEAPPVPAGSASRTKDDSALALAIALAHKTKEKK